MKTVSLFNRPNQNTRPGRFPIVSRVCIALLCLLVFRTVFGQESPSERKNPEELIPYARSPLLAGMEFDWVTHQRHAQGSDNFQLTWADDGHQYGAWGDGGGFGGSNSLGRVGLGIARIEGMADRFKGFNVWGGYQAAHAATFDGKSWGMLCVQGSLFLWVVPDIPENKSYRNHYEYVELARSDDHGASWTKYPWRFAQSEGVSIPTFVNFGADHTGRPERVGEYAYSYFIRPQSPTMEHQGPRGVGLIVHQPGAIYLSRVPLSKLNAAENLLRADFEFFAGLDAERQPKWGTLQEKQPVFEDPQGVGWCMSASFHSRFERVLLCTEHGTSSRSLLGFFESPTPWGPWSTVEYFSENRPFGSERQGSNWPWNFNIFFAAIPTKWIDDSHFVLTFTGAGKGQDNDSFNTVRGNWQLRERAAE